MPKFPVSITRTETYTHTFEIEADSAEAAKAEAQAWLDDLHPEHESMHQDLDKGYDECVTEIDEPHLPNPIDGIDEKKAFNLSTPYVAFEIDTYSNSDVIAFDATHVVLTKDQLWSARQAFHKWKETVKSDPELQSIHFDLGEMHLIDIKNEDTETVEGTHELEHYDYGDHPSELHRAVVRPHGVYVTGHYRNDNDRWEAIIDPEYIL